MLTPGARGRSNNHQLLQLRVLRLHLWSIGMIKGYVIFKLLRPFHTKRSSNLGKAMHYLLIANHDVTSTLSFALLHSKQQQQKQLHYKKEESNVEGSSYSFFWLKDVLQLATIELQSDMLRKQMGFKSSFCIFWKRMESYL